jgi:hypothetical protein
MPGRPGGFGCDGGIAQTADARVIIECRLSPRAQFWFWISADGRWNIDQVADIHQALDLVGGGQAEPLR